MCTIAQTAPFSIRLPADKRTRLSHLAKVQERTAHALAVRALNEYIEREEARIAYEEQAKKAYASTQVTGLHVTQEEMKHRTDGLNASNTSKAPECHG